VPGAGPLGGIAAGLAAAPHDLVAVVAVDMPFASPAVLVHLAGLWRGEAAVIPAVQGRWQPLHAVWARSAGPGITACLQAGERRVTSVVTTLGVRVVPETGTFAANLNVPADLVQAERSEHA